MRVLMLLIIAVSLVFSCAPKWVVEQEKQAGAEQKKAEPEAQKPKKTVKEDAEPEPAQARQMMDEELFERFKTEIQKFWKAPYVWGGASPQGTDCSGMIMTIYRNAADMKIPRNTRLLWEKGRPIAADDLRMGDLVFFNENGRGSKPTHVGMYIQKGVFIHASVSQGVTTDKLSDQYYSSRFLGARRLLK